MLFVNELPHPPPVFRFGVFHGVKMEKSEPGVNELFCLGVNFVLQSIDNWSILAASNDATGDEKAMGTRLLKSFWTAEQPRKRRSIRKISVRTKFVPAPKPRTRLGCGQPTSDDLEGWFHGRVGYCGKPSYYQRTLFCQPCTEKRTESNRAKRLRQRRNGKR